MKKVQHEMWSRNFFNILLVQFCLEMGQQMMNTLVPKYADHLGASTQMVGLISSFFSVASILALVFASPAFDCFSRKKIFILSIAGVIIAFLGFAFSSNIYVLLAFRFLQGAAEGCLITIALVMVSDALPKEKMGRGIGIFTLCQAIGQAVGPGIGLKLASWFGYREAFLYGTVMIMLAFVMAFRIQDLPAHGGYRLLPSNIFNPAATLTAIITFALEGPYCCIGSFITIYAAAMNVENIGLFFTVYAMCLLISRPMSGYVLDRIGYRKVLASGIVLFSISFYMISIARSLPIFLLAAAIGAFGFGICQPTLSYMCMSSVSSARRGAASSTNSIMMSLGFFFGVTFAGHFIDKLLRTGIGKAAAYSYMYRIMILPMVAAFVYLLVVGGRITSLMQSATEEEMK